MVHAINMVKSAETTICLTNSHALAMAMLSERNKEVDMKHLLQPDLSSKSDLSITKTHYILVNGKWIWDSIGESTSVATERVDNEVCTITKPNEQHTFNFNTINKASHLIRLLNLLNQHLWSAYCTMSTPCLHQNKQW